jgi:heme oxygenase
MLETTTPETVFDPGPALSHCLMHGHRDLHDAVERSHFVQALRADRASRQDYVGYLVNVLHDLDIVEPIVEAAPYPVNTIDFTRVARREAIRSDIAAFGQGARPTDVVLTHRAHLERIAAEAPSLLIPHVALRYLAVMFGGRMRAERLKRMWGADTPLRMYEFDGDPKEIKDAFLAQLDAFDERLDGALRARLRRELVTAWEFAGDLLGEDIRKLSAGTASTRADARSS